MDYKSRETYYNGISNYIYKHHFNLVPKSKDFGKIKKGITIICRDYLIDNNIKFKKEQVLDLTQKNWSDFKNYLNNL